jgi:hypothetical protein
LRFTMDDSFSTPEFAAIIIDFALPKAEDHVSAETSKRCAVGVSRNKASINPRTPAKAVNQAVLTKF